MRTPVRAKGAEPRPPKRPRKVCYIGAPEIFSLDQALIIVEQALGETPYLVGSAVERPDFRDVDIRIIMEDAKFERLFGNARHREDNPFWSLFCTAVSEYLERRTGLNIDFQVYPRGSVKESDWKKPRHPLGVTVLEEIMPAWNRGSRTT